MKLRNKKTGEIRRVEAREDGIYLYYEITDKWYKYELDLLARWWEYYEKPEEYWFISTSGESCRCSAEDEIYTPGRKEIGNYFETEEEAEMAVEKLKAWKRLRDKGFRFDGFDVANRGDNVICGQIYFKAGNYDREEIKADLDLLFGGEE